MNEREQYEAISAEYGISAGVVVRRDGTQETVSLQAVRVKGSGRGVRLIVHGAEDENSLMIIADGRRLAEQLLDPVDASPQG
jgi:hypothetical protein